MSKKSYKLSFPRWLCLVRFILRFIGAVNKDTKLHAESWRALYDEDLTPFQAIEEDLGGKYPFPFSLYSGDGFGLPTNAVVHQWSRFN